MRKIFIFLICLMCNICTWAITVRGIVTDESGDPIIGASVIEVGKPTNGIATDIDGKFSINVPASASLQVSYTGYVTQVVKVQGQTNLTIVLKEDEKSLDEVVVVAFGKMKKEAFTGSAGVVGNTELAKSQATSATQALAGRVPGLQLNAASSQPGESPKLTIRGVGSISSGTEPLYVVDGMPYDGDITLINPADIETMTVLKDAASNALYGARGANGVVMITTKRGSKSTSVTFDAKWGANTNAMPLYNTLNAQQFYETFYTSLYNYYLTPQYAETAKLPATLTAEQAHQLANSNLANTANTGVGPGYMVYTVPSGQDFILPGGKMNPAATMGAAWSYQGKDYWLQPDNWEKEGLRTGFRQEYNLNVSGAKDGLNYYGSFGYLENNGIQSGSGVNRLTGRVKVDYQALKWLKVGTNMNYTNYKYNKTSEGTVGDANSGQHSIGIGTIWSILKNRAPIYPVYLRNGQRQIMIDQWDQQMYDFANGEQGLFRGGSGAIGGNAIFDNKYRQSRREGNAYTVSGFADINILPELTLTINGSSYTYDNKHTSITSPFVDHYTSSNNNGSLGITKYSTKSYNTQQLLNYNKLFGKHDVGVLLGHEYYKYDYNYLTGDGKNFGINPSTEFGTLLTKNPVGSYSSTYNNEGYFGRVLYNYDYKYYANASFRRDASSRFDKHHRWGSFWSAGAAWMISSEDFFDVSWVDKLKVKLSVGSQGNDNIGNYLYANSYDVINNNDEVAFQWRQKGTKDITWETNTNWNAGIEFELFHHRLNGSLDYFYRKTSDMLFSLYTPPSAGYTSYYANVGDMRNVGFELVLDGTLVETRDFTWTANFNIGYVKNKVLKLPTDAKTMNVDGHAGYVNADGAFVSLYNYYVGEGLPLYTWYVYKTAGLTADGAQLYWKDVLDDSGNPTGQRETTENASQASYYLAGDAMSPWNGGFGTQLEYKGFDLSINLNFQLGGLTYDYTYQGLMGSGSTATSQNWHKDILNAWSPENTGSSIPRLRAYEQYSQNARSDRFLTDASYLNLQNINFGYTLPSSLTRKWGIQRIRVYFSGENLGYVSARKGLDPRMSNIGLTNPEMYSPIRTLSGGFQLAF